LAGPAQEPRGRREPLVVVGGGGGAVAHREAVHDELLGVAAHDVAHVGAAAVGLQLVRKTLHRVGEGTLVYEASGVVVVPGQQRVPGVHLDPTSAAEGEGDGAHPAPAGEVPRSVVVNGEDMAWQSRTGRAL